MPEYKCDEAKIRDSVRVSSRRLGRTPKRGMKDTPRRIAEMYSELFCGISQDR